MELMLQLLGIYATAWCIMLGVEYLWDSHTAQTGE